MKHIKKYESIKDEEKSENQLIKEEIDKYNSECKSHGNYNNQTSFPKFHLKDHYFKLRMTDANEPYSITIDDINKIREVRDGLQSFVDDNLIGTTDIYINGAGQLIVQCYFSFKIHNDESFSTYINYLTDIKVLLQVIGINISIKDNNLNLISFVIK